MIRKNIVSYVQRLSRISARHKARVAVSSLSMKDTVVVTKTTINGSNTILSKRPISFLTQQAWDIITTASLNPPNPLLVEVENQVDFEHVTPYHLVAAAKQVHQEYLQNLKDLEQTLENNEISAKELLEKLEELEAPLDYVHNVAALYNNLISTPDWEKAAQKVNVILENKPHESSSIIVKTLGSLQQESKARLLDDNDEQAEALQQSLQEIQARFLTYQSNKNRTTTRQKLEDIYSMMAIHSQQAKLFGFENYANYVLNAQPRMATSQNEIESLHVQIKDHFATRNLPSSTKYQDTRPYISLDGLLLATFGLIRAMFGIVFSESDSPRGWNPEVRLFSVLDEASGELLGKVYLDPFKRRNKVPYFLLSPLNRDSVFVSAPISSPAWNDEPTPLVFDDALSLIHEFGHVLQFMLAKNTPGVTTQSMPQDLSECMPQFMEYFLLEPAFLETVVHVSGAAEPMSSDVVQALRQEWVANKIQTINHRAFLGQLELEIFSQPEESLVALQRRLAQEYVPNDLPDRNDLQPLMTIMNDNANDRHVCRYRYLWGECIAASMFQVFQKAGGVTNQDKMNELGMQLRKAVLEPGGLVNGSHFKELCGTTMSPDALFEMTTIDKESKE